MNFYSKRNEVFVCDGVAHKRVKNARAAQLEAEILRELHGGGVSVPGVIGCRDNLLILEHLPGAPLPDIIERGEYDPTALALALCDWFAGFYAATTEGELRGDVNGRNFLYDEVSGKVFGVDFEERCFGPRARDAGRLAAFLATYETTDRAGQASLVDRFIRKFMEYFDCGAEEIAAEYKLELAAMRERRGG